MVAVVVEALAQSGGRCSAACVAALEHREVLHIDIPVCVSVSPRVGAAHRHRRIIAPQQVRIGPARRAVVDRGHVHALSREATRAVAGSSIREEPAAEGQGVKPELPGRLDAGLVPDIKGIKGPLLMSRHGRHPRSIALLQSQEHGDILVRDVEPAVGEPPCRPGVVGGGAQTRGEEASPDFSDLCVAR